MREVKLDLKSLYPDLETSGLHDYSILVDEMDVGSFSCESYGVCVSSKRTEERMVSTSSTPASRQTWAMRPKSWRFWR